MFRKTSLILNAVVIILSLLLFGYTFMAKSHLKTQTRTFVTEKTLSYSKPMVEFMKEGLNASLSQKLLSEALRSKIEEELAVYDMDPVSYVTSLTSERKSTFGDGKIANFKEKVYQHYQSTFASLMYDLRIFSGSNFMAGVFATMLLLVNKFGRNGKVVAFSFIIFAAVAFSSYSYLEGVTFLRIMLKSHLGWWYPAGIIVMIVGLVLEYGLHKEKIGEHPGDR